MGNLRPIGSEKLQGMDKINRMIEIARYNENIPQPVNEDKSNEFKKVLSDGNTYNIVKEKNGYVIKKGINESVHEYLEPMKNRKYYSSYSQALKRLNLIIKEVNVSEGYTKNLSLFNESEDNSERYTLKLPTDEQAAPAPAPEPQPAPAPAPVPAPSPAPTPSPEDEMGMEDDMGMDDDMGDEEGQDDEPVTLKTIQKLTGKLAQKLRAFSSIEEDGMTSNDTKYVINSVLSALDLDSLEEDDKEEIMSKFEGGSEEGMDDEGMGEEGMGDEGMGEEGMETEPPVSPEGEMGEEFMGNDEEIENPEEFVKDIFNMDEEESMDDMGDEYPRHGMRRRKSREDHRMSDDHAIHMEEMIEGMFSESKVDNILKKYFKIDEREKVLSEEKKKKQLIGTENDKKTVQRIKSLSESVSQEISSTKIIKKYPKAKLLGKNKNSNLVFEYNNKKLRVTPKGSIL
jgi:hypothetical protein